MDQHLPSLHFHYVDTSFYFPHRAFTKIFIASIFADHHKKINTINYIFCSDQYLLALNRQHLNHNYYTDIITFDLSNGNRISADIFISVERARENAFLFRITMISEIIRLLIHGALHLCGYKDKTKKDSYNMRAHEDKYLLKYSVSRETFKSNFNYSRET